MKINLTLEPARPLAAHSTNWAVLRVVMVALCTGAFDGKVHADESPGLLESTPSRFAIFDKTRIHYKSIGAGKTAVVFVHGFAADMSSWRYQVPAFAGRGRVILIDLPGHGQSDKPEVGYTMNLFARAIDAVLKDAGAEKAALVGHSMGTPVARQFYRLHPEKTIAIVAVDGMIVPLPFAAPDKVKALDGKMIRDDLLRSADSMFGKNMPIEARQSILAAVAATPDHVLQSTMNGLADPLIWKEDVIRVPLEMILCMNRYSPWPADYEQQVRKLAPDLEFHRIQGTGHFLVLEKPHEFNAVLAAFLKKQGVLEP